LDTGLVVFLVSQAYLFADDARLGSLFPLPQYALVREYLLANDTRKRRGGKVYLVLKERGQNKIMDQVIDEVMTWYSRPHVRLR